MAITFSVNNVQTGPFTTVFTGISDGSTTVFTFLFGQAPFNYGAPSDTSSLKGANAVISTLVPVAGIGVNQVFITPASSVFTGDATHSQLVVTLTTAIPSGQKFTIAVTALFGF